MEPTHFRRLLFQQVVDLYLGFLRECPRKLLPLALPYVPQVHVTLAKGLLPAHVMAATLPTVVPHSHHHRHKPAQYTFQIMLSGHYVLHHFSILFRDVLPHELAHVLAIVTQPKQASYSSSSSSSPDPPPPPDLGHSALWQQWSAWLGGPTTAHEHLHERFGHSQEIFEQQTDIPPPSDNAAAADEYWVFVRGPKQKQIGRLCMPEHRLQQELLSGTPPHENHIILVQTSKIPSGPSLTGFWDFLEKQPDFAVMFQRGARQ